MSHARRVARLRSLLGALALAGAFGTPLAAQDLPCGDPAGADAPDCGDGDIGCAVCVDETWGSCWDAPTLTGDWLGLRSGLEESGIQFAGRSTHFGFGVAGGVNTPVPAPLGPGDTFKYTGRGEYDLLFDLEKFGGLPFGKLLVRAEHWYGEFGNVSLRTGAFAPAVFPGLLPPTPDDPGVPYITNFIVTQPLSEELVVFAGKKDVLGVADQDDFAGGDGTEQFVNQALIANPAFLLGLPYSSFTAGVAMPRSWGMMSAFVFDPQNRTQDFFRLDDLFSQGVIVGSEIKLNTNFLEKPGQQHLGALWKHVDLTDLAFNAAPPGEYPEPVVPGFATKSDSYTIYYGFDQYLRVLDSDPRRGWGLFGRSSISDGNPTPIRYFLSTGVGGYSPWGQRRGDTFGVGWYYVGASDEFGPLPRTLLNPQDGNGVELYYSFQVTPWCNVTPDVQFLRPGARAISEDAFVYGLRLNMKL